jgi:hypothetical protein
MRGCARRRVAGRDQIRRPGEIGAGIAAAGVLASLFLIRNDELAATPSYEVEAEAIAEAA